MFNVRMYLEYYKLYFNVISPEKGKGHTFTFVSDCATALLRTQQPGDGDQ